MSLDVPDLEGPKCPRCGSELDGRPALPFWVACTNPDCKVKFYDPTSGTVTEEKA